MASFREKNARRVLLGICCWRESFVASFGTEVVDRRRYSVPIRVHLRLKQKYYMQRFWRENEVERILTLPS
jgi:hypothetical protein